MNNKYLKIVAILAAMALIPAGIAYGTDHEYLTEDFDCYELMQPLLEAEKAGIITTAQLLEIWEGCND